MNLELPDNPLQNGDVCRRKHGGNPESEAAFANLDAEGVRAAVLAVVREVQLLGFTADELAAMWNCSHNHVAPRLSELKRDGLVVRTSQRRRTRAGNLAAVYIAAEFVEAYTRQAEARKRIIEEERLRLLNGEKPAAPVVVEKPTEVGAKVPDPWEELFS